MKKISKENAQSVSTIDFKALNTNFWKSKKQNCLEQEECVFKQQQQGAKPSWNSLLSQKTVLLSNGIYCHETPNTQPPSLNEN